MLTSIDALVMHDSYCCTPPPATAPSLILETHCLTSDRVSDHIKPRGPGHPTQPYWVPHRFNKTGLSTARSHLATALLVISLELLFAQARGRVAVAKYGRLKTDTIRAQIVYFGFKREEQGGDIAIREAKG